MLLHWKDSLFFYMYGYNCSIYIPKRGKKTRKKRFTPLMHNIYSHSLGPISQQCDSLTVQVPLEELFLAKLYMSYIHKLIHTYNNTMTYDI